MRKLALSIVLIATPALAAKPKPPVVTTPPPPPPRATSVEVTVVEIAAGKAYVQPGEKAGVHKSAPITINGKEHRVIEVTDSYAVIDLQEGPVKEKDKGRCALIEAVPEAKQLPPPKPLSTWEHGWTAETPPADQQQPKFVPIGEASRNRKWDAVLAFTAGGIAPFKGQPGASIGYVQFDARLHAEPFSVPAALDVDGSLRFWAAADLSTRVGGSTRSYLWVRELLLSYGTATSWFAGIGRMKYAASTLGTLDGIRLQAPLGGGFTLSAFGGFLPNPLGGEIATDAQRFGMEARWYRPDLPVRPEAALVLHGSMFQGKPDERRASAMFGVYPGRARIGGHIEVSNFDSNNPWGAAPVEITAAGLDDSVRVGPFEIGSRIDFIEPERSRWLASYLPTTWFCRTVPTPGTPTNQEPCDGASSMRAQGQLTLSYVKGIGAVTIGGTAMGDVSHGTEPRVLGGYVSGRLVRIAKVLRLELSANYSNATYIDMFGGTAGLGVTVLHDALDVSAYYRRSELAYASASSTYLEQNGFGGAIVLFPTKTVMATVQGEAITGNDFNGVFVFGTIAWRPRF
jgi:hypothetical protein